VNLEASRRRDRGRARADRSGSRDVAPRSHESTLVGESTTIGGDMVGREPARAPVLELAKPPAARVALDDPDERVPLEGQALRLVIRCDRDNPVRRGVRRVCLRARTERGRRGLEADHLRRGGILDSGGDRGHGEGALGTRAGHERRRGGTAAEYRLERRRRLGEGGSRLGSAQLCEELWFRQGWERLVLWCVDLDPVVDLDVLGGALEIVPDAEAAEAGEDLLHLDRTRGPNVDDDGFGVVVAVYLEGRLENDGRGRWEWRRRRDHREELNERSLPTRQHCDLGGGALERWARLIEAVAFGKVARVNMLERVEVDWRQLRTRHCGLNRVRSGLVALLVAGGV
jgi:hypothetical protein